MTAFVDQDQRITVLHSFPVWLPQTQTWMYNQVRHLPEGVEYHIVCEKTQNLDQFRLPNLHSLSDEPPWRRFWDKGLRRLRIRNHLGFLIEQAKSHHARILHSHFGFVGWRNLEAARKTGLKHLVTFYGHDVNFLPVNKAYWRTRYQSLFEKIDLVLCEGPHMARCLEKLGCPKSKVRVHHLGVSVDDIAFKPRVWHSAEPLRVLIAGSFREKKGIPYALEALGQIQHEIPLQITLIGDANNEARNQAEKQKILTTIHRCKLGGKIRLLGYQPYAVLFEEAYKHHVFLSPSVTAGDGDAEGGAPVTIMEMAAMGMPVVSTTHCDIPQVIHNGSTGLLAKERDVEGLVHHLKWLVQNPQKIMSMVEAARNRIESEFNARLQAEKMAKTYREISGES